MASLVADRIERPPTLFDFVEEKPVAPAPVRVPAEPAAPEVHEGSRRDDVVTVPAGGSVREHDGVGGEFTLDETIVGAWEGLTAQAAVACPLCAGTLRPLYGGASAADPVVAGRCDSCGTTLS